MICASAFSSVFIWCLSVCGVDGSGGSRVKFVRGHGLGVFGTANKFTLAYGVGFLSISFLGRVVWFDFDVYTWLFELCVEFC